LRDENVTVGQRPTQSYSRHVLSLGKRNIIFSVLNSGNVISKSL